jgi:hypothetical protein
MKHESLYTFMLEKLRNIENLRQILAATYCPDRYPDH